MEGDFDIGTILYVVITLVAVLVGLLGRKKKPAGGGSQPGGGGESDFMKNLQRAFNAGDEEHEFEEAATEETTMREKITEMKRERREEMESRTKGMWEEYEELHGTQHEKQRIAESRSRTELEDEAEVGAEQEAAYETVEESVLTDTGEPADQLEVIELGEYEGTNYFDIVQNFDAVTAVIYSAIINRTEY